MGAIENPVTSRNSDLKYLSGTYSAQDLGLYDCR